MGVISLVDANGNSHNYRQIDGSHTQVTVKDPQNNIAYRYTAGYDMNMSATTTTNGAVDANGSNTVIVSAKTYADPNDPYRPSQVQDGNGYAVNGANGKGTWNYTWDQFGHCTGAVTPRGTATACAWNYANFALGEMTRVQQGAKSPITINYYEPSGLPQTLAFPAPGTSGGAGTVPVSFSYDALGNLLTLTVPGNNAAQSISETYSYTTDGAYTQNAAIGQPVAVTNNLGKATHFRYDAQGRPVSATDALGNEYDLTYTLAGQPQQITLPATGQTGTGHAAVQMSYLYPAGPLTQEALYDESGSLTRHIAPVYGPEGEAKTATGDVNPASVAYDALYRLKKYTDGNGHATNYAFNTAGYLQSVAYANGDSAQFTAYDANGNLLQRTDGRGQQIAYGYDDPESLLTSIQYANTPASNVTAGYDAYGKPASLADGTGARTWAFDDLGFLTSAVTAYTGLPAQTLAYSYYPNGQQSGLTTPGGAFSYTYDADGRPAGLTNPQGVAFGWTWLDNDWLWTQTSGSALVTTYAYNAAGQLTDLANRRSNMTQTLLSEFGGVHYDGAGDCLNLTSNVPGAAGFSGASAFGYDNLSRVTQETDGRGGGFNNGFGYDAANNLTTFGSASRTFNAANENLSVGNVYDGEGNPTTYRGTALTWDGEDRLTAIGGQMTAGYSGSMRAWQQTAAGRTYYLYDGDTPVCELDSGGNVLATNTFGANGLLARGNQAGSVFTTTLYAFDGWGNASQRLDTSGNVLETVLCSAWGGVQSSNPSNDPYRGGGAQDGTRLDSTGLYYGGGVYYDAGVGALLGRNPGGGAGGNGYSPFGLNAPPEPSGERQAENAPVQRAGHRAICAGGDDGDPGDTYIPTDGFDEIHQAGGGRRAAQMGRGFFGSLCDAIPGCGLIPALTGHDVWGCEIGGMERLGHGLAGIGSLGGAIGHFGGLIGGPATEAAGAVGALEGGSAGEGTIPIYRSPRPNQLPALNATGEMTFDLAESPGMQNLHVTPDLKYAEWYHQQYGTGIWKTNVPKSEYQLGAKTGIRLV